LKTTNAQTFYPSSHREAVKSDVNDVIATSGEEREVLAFYIEKLINGVHGEPIGLLLDLTIYASEEDKEIAWHRIAETYAGRVGASPGESL